VKRAAWTRRLRAVLIAHAPDLFARCCAPDDRELGEWGEEIAARYLCRRGCRLLGRRIEAVGVEIDIVALDRRSIVCVEVKTGRLEPLPRPRGDHDAIAAAQMRWRPGRRCDASRIVRLQRAARALARSGPDRRSGRVDLIEVFLPLATRRPRIVHHVDLRRPLG
jgi:putative endonuclease